jgi:hypothetical protein
MHKIFTGPTGAAIMSPATIPFISNSSSVIRRWTPQIGFACSLAGAAGKGSAHGDDAQSLKVQGQRHVFSSILIQDAPLRLGIARYRNHTRIHATRSFGVEYKLYLLADKVDRLRDRYDNHIGCFYSENSCFAGLGWP